MGTLSKLVGAAQKDSGMRDIRGIDRLEQLPRKILKILVPLVLPCANLVVPIDLHPTSDYTSYYLTMEQNARTLFN